MNLITKYKPKNLDDFIIDNKLKDLFKTLLDIDNLNILLNGDSSSGKTTLLYILINKYYNEEFENETLKQRIYKNNIYKINSLNEQGVNSFRQFIKSFCQTISIVPGKKKVVIIDELDTLNKSNQQILRNCIDKYSNKVHFICSCVNIQNVLDNMQSRLIIFKLPKLDVDGINSIVSNIIINENMDIDQLSLDHLYKVSNYNINIIINNLQKLLLLNKHINNELINDVCTNINHNVFEKYLNTIFENNILGATEIVNRLYDNGFSVNDILESFYDFIKITSIIRNDNKFIFFKIIGQYITNFYTVHDEKIDLFLFTQELQNILFIFI